MIEAGAGVPGWVAAAGAAVALGFLALLLIGAGWALWRRYAGRR